MTTPNAEELKPSPRRGGEGGRRMKMCKCGRLPRTPSGFYCKLCSGERNRQRGHLKSGSPEHREKMRASMLRRLQDQEDTDQRLKALRATMASEEYRDKIRKARAEREERAMLRAVESARRLNERAIQEAARLWNERPTPTPTDTEATKEAK